MPVELRVNASSTQRLLRHPVQRATATTIAIPATVGKSKPRALGATGGAVGTAPTR